MYNGFNYCMMCGSDVSKSQTKVEDVQTIHCEKCHNTFSFVYGIDENLHCFISSSPIQRKPIKIIKVTADSILFDDGSEITYDHDQDCCETNYADFEAIENRALSYEFPENLVFETVNDSGFRFGDPNGYKFFIPCYSDQNGYYSSNVDIYFRHKKVLNCEAKIILD